MKSREIVLAVFLILFSAISDTSAEEAKRPEEKSHIGTVTFTQTAGKYAYIKLDEQGKEVWLATLPMNVSVGDKVEYMGGNVMDDFHSKALDRTFDSIRFVIRIRVLNGDSLKDKQAIPSDEYHKNIPEKKQTVFIPTSSEIVKADNGKTIKEIISEREQLKDKEVTLRAKIIKVSKNILGKNWVTLQDGTGVSPDDSLIATTTETVNTGDVLTVKGTVITDVNIGAGYSYKVMIEHAVFSEPR